MNILDIILGVLLLLGLLRGFFKGFLRELAGLVALIAGIYGAIYFSDATLDLLQTFIDWEVKYLALVAFGLTFLLIALAFILLGSLLTRMVNLLALGLLNRIMGAAFGLLKVAFLASVFFMFLNQVQSVDIGLETKKNSVLYGPIEALATILLPTVLKTLEDNEVFEEEREENVE